MTVYDLLDAVETGIEYEIIYPNGDTKEGMTDPLEEIDEDYKKNEVYQIEGKIYSLDACDHGGDLHLRAFV